MRTLFVVLFFFFGFSNAHAQRYLGYEVDDCYIINERRVEYRGSDICVQNVNCGIRDEQSGTATRIEKQAICPTRVASTRCPMDGAECLLDDRLSEQSLKAILSLLRNQYRDSQLDCVPTGHQRNHQPEENQYRIRGVQGTAD